MKAKSNKTVWITVAAVVVIAAVIRLYNNQNTSDDVLFTDFIRSLLHIGLITAWGFSIYQRVVQKQARHYLCGIAVLMILWLNFKVMKYYICTDVNVSRYLWYLYYLPLVGIPLYTLFASLFIGKTEDYKLKWQVKLLYIPAILLFLMVMTNDLHKFAFSFPQHDFSPDNYQHGIGYFMVFGWFALCTFASFYVMYSGGKIKRKPRAFAPLIVALVLTVYYIITYMVENPVTKLLAGDLSSACSLLFAAVLECCIYCGLLPTNTRYDEMFEASVGNSAQIVDEIFHVRYASASAGNLSAEQIKKALDAPVALSEGKLLHTAPIGGGYMVWMEDISELTNLRKELTETKEELEELRSEKALLLQKFEYAEDAGAEAFHKDIAAMEAGLKKLETQEQKYSAELDKALDEYAELKAQAADFDPVELYEARQAIRPAQEKAAEQQLEDALQKKPSFSLLLSAKQEISRLLGEDTEERQVRQMLIRRQRSDPQKPKHFQR